METALLLGSLLLQVRSIICDPTWSNKDPSWRAVSIFKSVILNIASKERSHLLLRKLNPDHNPKKFRQMLSTERKRHEEAKDEIVSLRDEISKLNTELYYRIKDLSRNDKYADLLNELFQKGIINSDGMFISET